MSSKVYEKLPQNLPLDDNINENNAVKSKNSLNQQNSTELHHEEDLLLYDGKANKKPKLPESNKYKVVRIFSMAVIITLIIGLTGISVYYCLTCECVSKDFVELCDDGYCYDINVEKFEDSNNDTYGDFIGIKNSLQYLNSFGVQTLLLPIESFSSTNAHCDFESFVQMIKEAKKVGISTVIKLDQQIKDEYFLLIKQIKSFIDGFILPKDSLYLKQNDLLSDKLCYTIIASSDSINKPSNGCSGTYLEQKENIFNGSDNELLNILKKSSKTNSSTSILSIRSIESNLSVKKSQFLISLIIQGVTNGAMVIKSGDEFGKPLNGDFLHLFNNEEFFTSQSAQLMKDIFSYRKYKPYIKTSGEFEKVTLVKFPRVKILSKTSTIQPITSAIFVVWNQDLTNSAKLNIDDFARKPNVIITSRYIITKANSPDTELQIDGNNFTLQPNGIALISVKYKLAKVVN